ncbi:hypothetical protein [Microvirga tunisiensis]|uniref:hypothetical protein n=1 Tax=Microvirga tunisiensis TaxID=2108360 RepID=UPI00129C62B6|nr:hypothetical protein [Microvirga tunisiensis]
MKRRRAAAARRGRCQLAAEILPLLREGKVEAAVERLEAEIRPPSRPKETGHEQPV